MCRCDCRPITTAEAVAAFKRLRPQIIENLRKNDLILRALEHRLEETANAAR